MTALAQIDRLLAVRHARLERARVRCEAARRDCAAQAEAAAAALTQATQVHARAAAQAARRHQALLLGPVGVAQWQAEQDAAAHDAERLEEVDGEARQAADRHGRAVLARDAARDVYGQQDRARRALQAARDAEQQHRTRVREALIEDRADEAYMGPGNA